MSKSHPHGAHRPDGTLGALVNLPAARTGGIGSLPLADGGIEIGFANFGGDDLYFDHIPGQWLESRAAPRRPSPGRHDGRAYRVGGRLSALGLPG